MTGGNIGGYCEPSSIKGGKKHLPKLSDVKVLERIDTLLYFDNTCFKQYNIHTGYQKYPKAIKKRNSLTQGCTDSKTMTNVLVCVHRLFLYN